MTQPLRHSKLSAQGQQEAVIKPVQENESGHLPGCKLLTFREIANDAGKSPPADDEWYDQGGILQCVEGCPHREAAREALDG